MIKIKAFAKLNLFLNITGKLESGYHTLEMVMQSVDLFDLVKIENASDFSVECDGVDMLKNSAYKSGLAFFEKTGIYPRAKITIDKNIPIMAGLGGGSADAAAAIFGLNELYNRPLRLLEMRKIAKHIGADVPFALQGGCAAAYGIGEILKPIKNNLDCCYLILKPIAGCNTALCYSKYDKNPLFGNETSFLKVIDSLEKGDITSFCGNTFNALTNAAVSICPEINDTLGFLKEQDGCIGTFMTGSGSACVSVFNDSSSANRASSLATSKYNGFFSAVCKNAPFGLQIL